MSQDILAKIQSEVQSLREYCTNQEIRIQSILNDAMESKDTKEAPTANEDSKIQELQDALEKSKTAARAADGKIKLLQYQLAKAKTAPKTAPISTNNGNTAKKVTFQEEHAVAANHDWLLHWLRMKAICRSLTNHLNHQNQILEPRTILDETMVEDTTQIDIDQEISRCAEMGNMLDELGVLSASFVSAHVADDEIAVEETSPIETPVESVEEKELIPKSMHAKLFLPISPSVSVAAESVETVTSRYQSDVQSTADSLPHSSDSNKPSNSSSSYCSLRMYMESKQLPLQLKTSTSRNTSPASVVYSQCMLDQASMFSPPIQQNKSSLVTATEMKLLFRGFQSASPATVTGDISVHAYSTVSALTPATCHNPDHPDHLSSLGRSHWTNTPEGLQTASSKKNLSRSQRTLKSACSTDMKTISRLLDNGSSFVTENTDADLSCHTLTTEFDLLHDFRAYEKLRGRIIDVEQPLMSAKIVH